MSQPDEESVRSSPVRVAHITTVDMSLRYLLLNQLQCLQTQGYQITGISAPGSYTGDLERAGIRHIGVPFTRTFTPLLDLLTLFHLVKMLRRERFVIVHTHNPKPGLLGQLAARMAGVPIVVNTLHGFYFHDHMPALWRRFYVILEKIAARCSDAILSQNQEDIHTAALESIGNPEKIRYLGNGIDVCRFDRTRLDRNSINKLRQTLDLLPGDKIIGFVGRLVAEKGLYELFEAARLVLAEHPDTRFLIIGPIDSEKQDFLDPRVAQDYGIADACIFTGKRDDMPELYALMDVFVLPSHREGFPRSPMEASAMGVPCIVTDIRGCREAVTHDKNGLLVPLKDSQALANAIKTLLSDAEKRRQLGTMGRQMALEQFDERDVFERVHQTYARLLEDKDIAVPLPNEGSLRDV